MNFVPALLDKLTKLVVGHAAFGELPAQRGKKFIETENFFFEYGPDVTVNVHTPRRRPLPQSPFGFFRKRNGNGHEDNSECVFLLHDTAIAELMSSRGSDDDAEVRLESVAIHATRRGNLASCVVNCRLPAHAANGLEPGR
jgi:hypothetical protein